MSKSDREWDAAFDRAVYEEVRAQIRDIMKVGTGAGPVQNLGGVHFSPGEVRVMKAMVERSGVVSARALAAITSLRPGDKANTVRTHICNLRIKLKRLGVRIRNSHGSGYYMEAGDKAVLTGILKEEGKSWS